MAYREGERIKSRAKLGFAVKDIIDNMPGAFIVYRFSSSLFFANAKVLVRDIEDHLKQIQNRRCAGEQT